MPLDKHELVQLREGEKENGKLKRGREKRKKRKTSYSLPSLRERSETPKALDRRDWESQETPVAKNRPFGFGPHYRLLSDSHNYLMSQTTTP